MTEIPKETLASGLATQELSLSAARRLVQSALGNRARIWRTADGFLVGLDLHPGRASLSFGATLSEAVSRAFDPTNQIFGKTSDAEGAP